MRAIRKVAQKFSPEASMTTTDIHMQVKPESGELITYNDDDEELNRCVVEQWIGSSDELYDDAAEQLRRCLDELRKEVVDKMNIARPYSFLLVNDENETVGDLYLVDDEEMMLSGSLLENLDKDLDEFLRKLMS